MDRKGIVAVALAFATLIAWMIFNQRAMDKAAAEQARKRAAVAEQQAEEAAQPKPETPAPPVVAAVPKPAAEITEPEKIETAAPPRLLAQF